MRNMVRGFLGLVVVLVTLAWVMACTTFRAAEPTDITVTRGADATTPAMGSAQRLKLYASSRFDHQALANGTPLGGLSAITGDAIRQQWYALSDDRSSQAPARFYTLQWQLETPTEPPTITAVTTLLAADGKPFPQSLDSTREGIPVIDPEAMRYHPQRDTLFWTSEGDMQRGLPPFVAESRRDGTWLRAFDLPEVLLAAFERKQMRNNATFEGLALHPNGKKLWVGMEGALRQDSHEPTTRAGALLRFTAFDVETGKAVKQVLYRTDPLPFVPLGYASMGVTELDFDAQGNLLVLERAYMAGVGVSVRLYRVLAHDLAAAVDVQQQAILLQPAVTLPKTLVIYFNHSGLRPLDNMEGMCQWQPTQTTPPKAIEAANRAQTNGYMLFVTDNNFNAMQVTQLSAFAWE